MESKRGPTQQGMKGNMHMGRSTDTGNSFELMEAYSMDSSLIIIFTGMEIIHGAMGGNTSGSGQTTKCMVKGSSLGQIRGAIKENM